VCDPRWPRSIAISRPNMISTVITADPP